MKELNGLATPKQCWALFCLTKKDYRKSGLSRQEAHDLIQSLIAEKDSKPRAKSKGSDSLRIFNLAVEAGEQAARATVPLPMVVEQHVNMTDDNSPVAKQWYVPSGVCGFASISLKCNNPANRRFINDLKKVGYVGEHRDWQKRYNGGYYYWVSIGGQSLEIKEAFAYAFNKVLRDNGVTAYVSSRMD
jgi:hypothetical protein